MENASKSCLSEAYKNHWYTKPFKTWIATSYIENNL